MFLHYTEGIKSRLWDFQDQTIPVTISSHHIFTVFHEVLSIQHDLINLTFTKRSKAKTLCNSSTINQRESKERTFRKEIDRITNCNRQNTEESDNFSPGKFPWRCQVKELPNY